MSAKLVRPTTSWRVAGKASQRVAQKARWMVAVKVVPERRAAEILL